MKEVKKYVALLRGINVGGNKKVSMKVLKDLFEKMGYKNVVTYINSGNVIFESDQHDFAKIEKILEQEFGFNIQVIVRDGENVVRLCDFLPTELQNNKEQKTDIIFLADNYVNKKTLDLIIINPDVDKLQYFDGAIVWNVKREDYSKSKMRDFIGTEVYKNMTARNINTVRKLGKMISLN